MENSNEYNIFQMLDNNRNMCWFCFYELNDVSNGINVISDQYIQKLLQFCFPNLKLFEEIDLPKVICVECSNSLINAYNLSVKIQTSQNIFEKYLAQKQGNRKHIGIGIAKESVEELTNYVNNESFLDICSDKSDSLSDINVSCDVRKSKKTCRKSRKIFKCCSEEFKTKATYMAHVKNHRVTFKKYTCVECNKKYVSQFELQVHLRKHSGDKPFSCSLCEKLFSDKRNLRKHEKIHTGKKTHECLICHKNFLHLFTLKTHERLHTGEKLYVCESCGSSFNTSTQLTIHTRTHTKEKPYDCNYCDKKFSSKAALNNHVLVHTGDKKFGCTVCNKKCRSGYDLKTHLRSHTNEKPYFCNYPNCEKRYKTSSQLSVHFRTHTGEKRHQCSVCLKQFGEATTLKRHMGIHGRASEKT